MNNVKQAMILAAGMGKRMKLSPHSPPKPLTPIAGISLLERMIRKLEELGIEKIIINVHYKADTIETHLTNIKCKPKIIISDERQQLLDTGGGVVNARHLFDDDPLLICNSDVLWIETQSNLNHLNHCFNIEEMDVLLLLVPLKQTKGYDGHGDFYHLHDKRIQRKSELLASSKNPFVYTGIQMVHPQLFSDTKKGVFSFNQLWDKALIKNRAFGHILDGTWLHVGTPEGVKIANDYIRNMPYPHESYLK